MKKLIFITVLLIYISSLCSAATPEEAKIILLNKGIAASESALISNIPMGNTQNIQLLLDAGVSPDSKNQFGWTALMVALTINQQDIAKILLDAGANVNAKSNIGDTPIYVAVLSGNKDIVEKLISLGAKPYEKNKLGLSAYSMAQTLNRS
ncbi:MAG: ankyrin repeat domain-containing protein [Negativicutes bacterium]